MPLCKNKRHSFVEDYEPRKRKPTREKDKKDKKDKKRQSHNVTWRHGHPPHSHSLLHWLGLPPRNTRPRRGVLPGRTTNTAATAVATAGQTAHGRCADSHAAHAASTALALHGSHQPIPAALPRRSRCTRRGVPPQATAHVHTTGLAGCQRATHGAITMSTSTSAATTAHTHARITHERRAGNGRRPAPLGTAPALPGDAVGGAGQRVGARIRRRRAVVVMGASYRKPTGTAAAAAQQHRGRDTVVTGTRVCCGGGLLGRVDGRAQLVGVKGG